MSSVLKYMTLQQVTLHFFTQNLTDVVIFVCHLAAPGFFLIIHYIGAYSK